LTDGVFAGDLASHNVTVIVIVGISKISFFMGLARSAVQIAPKYRRQSSIQHGPITATPSVQRGSGKNIEIVTEGTGRDSFLHNQTTNNTATVLVRRDRTGVCSIQNCAPTPKLKRSEKVRSIRGPHFEGT
jgi:hypothetical protein